MPKDWAKSRLQLLSELKQLRNRRGKVARQYVQSPKSETAEGGSSRLDTLCRVTGALSSTETLAEATPTLLGELAESGGWDAGILWLTSEPDDILKFTGGWSADGVLFQDLESLSRQSTFLPGRGPLGHFWGNGEQSTLFDLNLESRSPRSLYAVRAGLHWAFLFPIWHRKRLMGFFEFFSKELTSSDGEYAKLLAASGHQVVQRLLRERAEQHCGALACP